MSDHPNIYWNADKSVLVEEGDERAAFLAYAPGDTISDDDMKLLKGARSAAPAASDEAPTEPAKSAPKRAVKPRKPKG